MRSCKILVADDSVLEADRIRQVLEALPGVEITVVDDGARAISESKNVRFDLVLCDYEMPALNGLQVVRVLRSRWSRLELPILMLTVRDDLQTKLSSFKHGANDYVTKPVQAEELLARVQAQLDLKALMDENIAARMQMLETRKLETVGRLAAGVAHELNTPAQFTADNIVFLQKVFLGTSEVLSLLRDRIGGLSAADHPWVGDLLELWQRRRVTYLLAEAPKALDESINGVMRMARIVRDLREFAGAPDRSWELGDINRALENTVAVSRPLWSSSADVTLALAPDLPQLNCDVTALKQAFFNLIACAVELAHGDSPPPRAVVALEIASSKSPGDALEVSFRADGPGVPSAVPESIQRALTGNELPGVDHGGGLAMAQYVVTAQHRGELRCDLTPGKRIHFVMRLPQGQAGPRERSQSEPHSSPPRRSSPI